MVRSIIKEVIIILLLIVAILLALGVVFYDYIPTNKQIPSVSTYKTSESMSKELSEQVKEEEQVLVTMQVTEQDLKGLKTSKDYKPGKSNPFSSYKDETQVDENGNPITINGTVGSSSAGTTTNTFYKPTGTK